MIESLASLLTNLVIAIPSAFGVLLNPADWLNWSDKQALMRFVYYGASFEFLYFFIAAFMVVAAVGLWRHSVLWGTVRILEFIGNWVGRFFAWGGLVMVVQQVMIVFLQRIFRVPEISIGPFGYAFTRDLSWYGEELKLYNAMVVCLCCGYTFIQGGHVRVDLFYAGASHRIKKCVDMAGSILFMMPALLLIWLYSWFFMWRHLIVPKPSASDTLERLLMKSRAVRWNVETIGFSPSGFDGYFIFKVLLVAFSGLLILQAVAFFYRSLLEFLEGPESAGRYSDPDRLDQPVSANAD